MNKRDFILLLGVSAAAAVLLAARLRLPILSGVTDGQLAFVPAALIVLVVLLFYGRVKESEQRERLAAQAAALVTEAEQAHARAAELAALVRFSQALNFCTDLDALRQTVSVELPRLIGHHGFWLRTRPGWEAVVISPSGVSEVVPSEPEAWETFPLVAGERRLGVLGVRQADGPLPEKQRRTLELAALMLAVSIRNVQLFKRISDFSLFDPLTECLTRPQGLQMFTGEIRRAQRAKSEVSVLLMDIDQFQTLTDHYGEALIDHILVRLGRLFKVELRASDLRCRYTAGQFAFMLPDTGMQGALRAGDNLRQKITELSVAAADRVGITVSIGVAEVLPGENDASDVLKRAEAALSRAIREGRNRVAVNEEPHATLRTRR